jgi:serine/threonine-protein kinase ATR
MAPTANGVPVPQDPGSFLNGAPNQRPPPSTLAAQLVGNISASSRSSRPDETAELKKLFGIIEKVKNQPGLLSTPEQRVEHNHMLIYVYARVVLEGLRWDDIFADKPQLREEATRAISFLKITIRETPDVLLLSPQDTFIFRGREPLWLWILPKVLKMLGHSQCLALTSAIEDLLQQIFLVMCQTGSLWPLVPAFLQYMQTNFSGAYFYLCIPLCTTDSLP